METLTLKFVSPKILNELGEARSHEPELWLEEGTEDELELDTCDWNISSSAQQATIDQWEVNQMTHRMRLKSGNSSDGFEPLDYPFAISMIGQIGNKQNLQDYLDSLQKIYLLVITTTSKTSNNTLKKQHDE